MKLYRFALLFFDDTVLTGKFCVGVPLNIQSIYPYTNPLCGRPELIQIECQSSASDWKDFTKSLMECRAAFFQSVSFVIGILLQFFFYYDSSH